MASNCLFIVTVALFSSLDFIFFGFTQLTYFSLTENVCANRDAILNSQSTRACLETPDTRRRGEKTRVVL